MTAPKKTPNQPPKRGPNSPLGRAAGVPNKINRDVKEMVLEALNRVGGAAYLAERAKDNPTSFMALLGKIMPHQGIVDGPNGSMSLHLVAAKVVSQQLLEERARQPEPRQDRHLTIDQHALPTE